MIRAATMVLALAAGAAPAEPRDDMGRLAHSGFKRLSHCTAALLEGGHILSAAHCLPGVPSDTVHVALGYDRGDLSGLISAPGGDYRTLSGRDLAMLCAPAETPGLAMPRDSDAPLFVDVWGYGRPYVHVLNQKSCAVARADATRLILDCPSTPGASGGPVTVGAPPRVVGVVSRASKTRTVVERFGPAERAALCP